MKSLDKNELNFVKMKNSLRKWNVSLIKIPIIKLTIIDYGYNHSNSSIDLESFYDSNIYSKN